MENLGLDIIIKLEKDLVQFYEKVCSVARFRPFLATFSLMALVSENHRKKIARVKKKYKKPVFNNQAAYDLHTRIKEKLWDEITAEKDEEKIIRTMAGSEEHIGDLYKAMSEFFSLLGSHYLELANEIEQISNEEYQHRDALLKLLKK